jgi:hypothetical protein
MSDAIESTRPGEGPAAISAWLAAVLKPIVHSACEEAVQQQTAVQVAPAKEREGAA